MLLVLFVIRIDIINTLLLQYLAFQSLASRGRAAGSSCSHRLRYEVEARQRLRHPQNKKQKETHNNKHVISIFIFRSNCCPSQFHPQPKRSPPRPWTQSAAAGQLHEKRQPQRQRQHPESRQAGVGARAAAGALQAGVGARAAAAAEGGGSGRRLVRRGAGSCGSHSGSGMGSVLQVESGSGFQRQRHPGCGSGSGSHRQRQRQQRRQPHPRPQPQPQPTPPAAGLDSRHRPERHGGI